MSDDKDENDYKESVSGFKITGDWNSIVEHGERISYTLEKIGIKDHKSGLDEYNEWRPKITEDRTDISEKTADSASIDTDDENPKEDITKAKEKASEGVSDISDADARNAYNDSTESAKHTVNAIKGATKETFKKSEKIIYENVMTKLSPYYFDNPLISANISKKSDNVFSFEININIDEVKTKVSDNLQDVYDDVDQKDMKEHLDSTELDTIDEEKAENHIAAELDSDKPDLNFSDD